ERMVSPGIERTRHPGEESRSIVRDARALPVPRRGRAVHPGAVEGPDRLMPETDAQERDSPALRRRDHLEAAPGLLAAAGPASPTDGAGPGGQRVLGIEAIVPRDAHVRVQLAQRLDEVERERVVVVHDEDHASLPCPIHSRASAMDRKSASALVSASRYSLSATESATMPAPAWMRQRPFSTTAVRIAIAMSQ